MLKKQFTAVKFRECEYWRLWNLEKQKLLSSRDEGLAKNNVPMWKEKELVWRCQMKLSLTKKMKYEKAAQEGVKICENKRMKGTMTRRGWLSRPFMLCINIWQLWIRICEYKMVIFIKITDGKFSRYVQDQAIWVRLCRKWHSDEIRWLVEKCTITRAIMY